MSDDDNIISDAINQKSEPIRFLTSQLDKQTKEYEEKIKNLMSSINKLKAKADKAEEEQKNQIRINIINNLKKERLNQEQIIQILRRKVSSHDQVVDKYLLEQINLKQEESRILTNEDL